MLVSSFGLSLVYSHVAVKEMTSRRDSHGVTDQKRGIATEHARQPLVLERNPKAQQCMEDAQHDRADDSMINLTCKLNDFLTHVVQEMYPFLSPRLEINYDDIEDMIFEKISDWVQKPRENTSYSHSELLLHKKIWDVVNCDKDGTPKDHTFVDWCRRISLHRNESAATEHEDPFRRMVEDIFANELTPKQQKQAKYMLREDATIPSDLRSLVNVILRKNLGDSRVALYILQHGIPTLLDASLLRHPLQSAAMETMLEELMVWHASLLNWLDKRQNDPTTIIARKLSDLDQKQWQAERRCRKYELQQQLRQGAHLAELRDTKRKRFDDMSATEQRVLEDYDTGKLQKLHNDVRIQKPGDEW